VIGGGFIGAEVAASARQRGLDVTIVEAADRMMARVMPLQASAHIEKLHEDHGVTVRVGVGVHRGHGARRIEALELADGTVLPADVVVIGVGSVPSTQWLQASGLQLADGVVCDSGLRAIGTDNVWAVGDVARWFNTKAERQMRIEHWTSAREHSSFVAGSMASGAVGDCGLVPYVWSDQYDVRIQHVGETAAEVRRLPHPGSDNDSFVLEYWDAGNVVGATGFNAQRAIMDVRRELAA